MKTVLEARNVTFRYFENSKKPVLENLNLSLEEGTVTLLCGKSGCGKSTLAFILAGLYPENGGFLSGKILIDGKEIHKLTPGERIRYVGMLFQNCDLQFCMDTLRAELIFCAENRQIAEDREKNEFDESTDNGTKKELLIPKKTVKSKKKAETVIFEPEKEDFILFEKIAKSVGVLHLLDTKFSEMSGGEKQKCAFCCILLLKSRVVVLDEAFANVDFESARELVHLIRSSGLTVLAVDHNRSLWEGAHDSIVWLDNCEKTEDFPVKTSFRRGIPAISCRNASAGTIQYPDMDFERGCISAVLGKSGRGKTTLFKTLIGQTPYSGDILLNGREVRAYKRSELYKKCALVFQNPANQFLTLSVFDEVYFSVAASLLENREKSTQKAEFGEISKTGKNRIFFDFFIKKSLSDGQKSEAAAKTRGFLTLFGLSAYEKYPPYLLSQGQQRRLAVLAMIAGGQEILLLDEPTYGQDFENILAIMKLLEARADTGLTVIFNTHSEKTAKAFADKIIYLY